MNLVIPKSGPILGFSRGCRARDRGLAGLVDRMQANRDSTTYGLTGNAVVQKHLKLIVDYVEVLRQSLAAELLQPAPVPLQFHDAIRFDAVRFHYTSDGPEVLGWPQSDHPQRRQGWFCRKHLQCKSTTLDLLMGLLMPTKGQLLADGQSISGERLRAWQLSIAHMSQSIYLADSTLAENIALGVPRNAIDLDRV
jgi:ABC-type multidrug transport system fused ATPase/permease subunit